MRQAFKKFSSRKGQKGQAALEFIVVIIAVFFFLLFYLSLSMLFVVSDYIEYATFMAARTYKSGFSNRDYQEKYARQVFNTYVSKIQGIATNFNLQMIDVPENEQTSGVIASYDIALFYLPPLFVLGGTPIPSRLTLTSEAHLGRDPAFEDCLNYFNTYSQKNGLGIENSQFIQQMDDNGC